MAAGNSYSRSSVAMNASAAGAMPMNDPFDVKMPSMGQVKQGAENMF
jgi:hypothetical protein